MVESAITSLPAQRREPDRIGMRSRGHRHEEVAADADAERVDAL